MVKDCCVHAKKKDICEREWGEGAGKRKGEEFLLLSLQMRSLSLVFSVRSGGPPWTQCRRQGLTTECTLSNYLQLRYENTCSSIYLHMEES